jgi:hypothetical protein
LQVAVLDLARFLIYSHQNDSQVISEIGQAMIPAFQSFRLELQGRLIAFFLECVLGDALSQLRQTRTLANSLSQGKSSSFRVNCLLMSDQHKIWR